MVEATITRTPGGVWRYVATVTKDGKKMEENKSDLYMSARIWVYFATRRVKRGPGIEGVVYKKTHK